MSGFPKITREPGSFPLARPAGWKTCGKCGCKGDYPGVVGGIALIGRCRMGQEGGMQLD
jgi:hypothetical protein